MKTCNRALFFAAIALTTLLTGCGTPRELIVKPTDLRVHILPGSPFSGKIGVGTAHDETTESIFNDAKVGAGIVSLSLQDSLESVGYLAPKGENSCYTVHAVIRGNSMSKGFIDVTSKVSIDYTLEESSSKAEVYHKTLNAEYTAGMKDTWSGPNRPTMAKYNAVRLTVEQFLNDITSVAGGQ